MTHEPGCPCNNADERGCFLISAKTDKCLSCTCGKEPIVHDPLCPYARMTDWVECDDCELIAKTRKDERAAAIRDAISQVEALANKPGASSAHYLAALHALTQEHP